MKKVILGIILVLFISGALFLVFGSINRLHDQSLLTKKINHLPQFSFLSLTNDSFSSSEITEGPLLIINFHPECEHCKYEISALLKSNIIESGIKVILVSSAVPDTLKKFLTGCQTEEAKRFITLIDTAIIFGDIFGRNIIPSNYLYDKELNLIEVLYGEYTTETILERFRLSGQNK